MRVCVKRYLYYTVTHLLFPYHTPEVRDCVFQWCLSSNECPRTVVAMDEVGIDVVRVGIILCSL